MQSRLSFAAFSAFADIRAVTLDLDDTLWPTWPPIERAERVLLEWQQAHAPATAQSLQDTAAVRAVRAETSPRGALVSLGRPGTGAMVSFCCRRRQWPDPGSHVC